MDLTRIPRQLENRYVAGTAVAAALVASTVVVTNVAASDGDTIGSAVPAANAAQVADTDDAIVSGAGAIAVDPPADEADEHTDATAGEPGREPPVAEIPEAGDGSTDEPADEPGADPTTVPQSAPQPEAEPTPDELEGPDAPEAGRVTNVGVTEQPVPDPEPAPPAPTWSEAHLNPVEPAAPTDELASVPPTPADVPPLGSGGPADELVVDADGCQLSCISSALLSQPALDSDLHFDLTTTVPTAAAAWLLDGAPQVVSGVPQVGAWPHAMSGVYDTGWSTEFEVEPDTTYHFVLRVEDDLGHEAWAMTPWTTQPAAPDQLVGNGDGCYHQCIDFGAVYPTDTYSRVDLVIGTSVSPHEDVDFDVAVSPSEPGWIGHDPATPFLPQDHPFVLDQDGGNDIRGHVAGLAPQTTYHVVVRATDEDGFTAHAVGRFTTDPEPPPPPPTPLDVEVGWERIYVHYDGDQGGWGRGELAFAWGLDAGWSNAETGMTSFGWRNEEKIDDNTSVPLGGHSHTWIEVWEGDTLPKISVTAHENDTHGNVEHDVCRDLRQHTYQMQHYNSSCMTRINIALEHDLTLDDIRAMPSCVEFGIPDKHDHHCMVTKSHHANDQHAQFDAVLSFRIAE